MHLKLLFEMRLSMHTLGSNSKLLLQNSPLLSSLFWLLSCPLMLTSINDYYLYNFTFFSMKDDSVLVDVMPFLTSRCEIFHVKKSNNHFIIIRHYYFA